VSTNIDNITICQPKKLCKGSEDAFNSKNTSKKGRSVSLKLAGPFLCKVIHI